MKRLIGLYRETEFSPGRHKSNDARLLELVADRLREKNFVVDLVHLADTTNGLPPAAMIFSMCQGNAALGALRNLESKGVRIINSPRGAINTYRDRLPQLMLSAGISFPETQLVSTNGREPDRFININQGIWLKRGDVHATVAADVQWIESQAGLHAALADYAARGIRTAAVQTHQQGDEIKFYGVGDEFFHWFYAGEARGYPFEIKKLSRLAANAARAAGLEIFGGDIIVSPSGALTIIDLNDWPSFAPCLGPGSEAIAEFIAKCAGNA